ncbi:hypothetical protein Tsubulata_043672 [Turnera subulata]|uniref:Myb/SANT-like domain-containing protein n=1 Tax=Turnera subulata TaxID=218843 RepID=A0A9Q0J188_9ROSI|nr:hypothetical protein Tsubulata_043672 [Turnera subulata]
MGDRRVWTSEEEVAIVDILEELVVDGHRVDAGQFRPGPIGIIVAKLTVRIPNAKIGQKHAKNKMKRLKQKYSVAADMANYSGFGWDDARLCVVVDSQDILDEYLLKFPNRAYICSIAFPPYPRLKEIFGHDRATGVNAEVPEAAMEEEVGDTMMVSNAAGGTSNVVGGTSNAAIGVNYVGPTDTPSVNDGQANDTSMVTSGSYGSRKRKASSTDAMWALTDAIIGGIEQQDRNMKHLASAIVGKDERRVLGEEFKKMGLTVSQAVKVVKKMCMHPEYAVYFWELDEDQKLEFVMSLLGE